MNMTTILLIIALIMLMIVIFAGIWLTTMSEDILIEKKAQEE